MLSISKEIVDISHPFLSYILLFGFVSDREYALDVDYHYNTCSRFFFFFFFFFFAFSSGSAESNCIGTTGLRQA